MPNPPRNRHLRIAERRRGTTGRFAANPGCAADLDLGHLLESPTRNASTAEMAMDNSTYLPTQKQRCFSLMWFT